MAIPTSRTRRRRRRRWPAAAVCAATLVMVGFISGFFCNLMIISSTLEHVDSGGTALVNPISLLDNHNSNSTRDAYLRRMRVVAGFIRAPRPQQPPAQEGKIMPPKVPESANAMDHNDNNQQPKPPQQSEKASTGVATATRANATDHPPPRKMSDTKNPIYFIHVGKTGGTSVHSMLSGLSSKHLFNKKTYVKRAQNHYDWSFIQQQRYGLAPVSLRQNTTLEEFDVTRDTDVMTWLRNPVERAISQFYYAKTNHWVLRKKKIEGYNPPWLGQTIDQYMNDANRIFTQPLSDGESGVRWLAGIWGDDTGWVTTSPFSDAKRYLKQNKTAAILLAAKRLESTVWFGLLEEKERSLKLLQLSMGLKDRPGIKKSNAGKHKDAASNATRQKIERHLPQDMWLYEYARRLFEARWVYLAENGSYVHPDLPPLPDFFKFNTTLE